MPVTFTAPWSRQLKLLSTLACALLLGISIVLQLQAPANPPLMYRIGIWIPIFFLCATALFAIRGYRVEGNDLLIVRPGWHSRISLQNLQSAQLTPDAMSGSIRLFGNGGLFGFIGLYRNKTLGRYRAFVTDTSRTVVIRLADRTIVISPKDPDYFLRTLEQARR